MEGTKDLLVHKTQSKLFGESEDIVAEEMSAMSEDHLEAEQTATSSLEEYRSWDRQLIFRLMCTVASIAPDEFRNSMWITIEADLQHIISNGLIPEDTLESAGLDRESYDHFMNCVTEIREKIWESELSAALSILRGARRIFSASNDDALRHVFCGPPIEVLANIYYDGIGVLHGERMIIQDPFHYSRWPAGQCDT